LKSHVSAATGALFNLNAHSRNSFLSDKQDMHLMGQCCPVHSLKVNMRSECLIAGVKDLCLVQYDTVKFARQVPMFQQNLLHQFSGQRTGNPTTQITMPIAQSKSLIPLLPEVGRFAVRSDHN
jgi:hypothetical protein